MISIYSSSSSAMSKDSYWFFDSLLGFEQIRRLRPVSEYFFCQCPSSHKKSPERHPIMAHPLTHPFRAGVYSNLCCACARLEALRYREFRLLWYGQVFTSMATWMDSIARGWLIYELTDSSFQLGLVRGVQAIPTLLAFADRGYRRRSLFAQNSDPDRANRRRLALCLGRHHDPDRRYPAVARLSDFARTGDACKRFSCRPDRR